MKNLDFSWFTTMPGLLITGGVLLLTIALIMFIVSGKKSKKEKAAKEAEQSGTQDVIATPATTQVPVVDPNAMTVPVGNIPMAPVDAQNGNTSDSNVGGPVPVDPMVVNSTVQNSAMPEVATPAMPEVLAAPAMPEVPAAPAMPEVSAAPTIQSTHGPVIYGGASPVVGNVTIDNGQSHQIYGGADPLENTQPIPGVAAVQPVAPVSPVMTTPATPTLDQSQQ